MVRSSLVEASCCPSGDQQTLVYLVGVTIQATYALVR